MNGQMGIDIVALSWCIPEIRESLLRAASELDQHLASEADSTLNLKNARIHLHQAHGALQVADLAGVLVLTQEAESLIERGERGELSIDGAAVLALKRALSAVTEYLEDLQAGATLPPVVLFSFYRDLLLLRRAERIDPADLYFPDLGIQPPAGILSQCDAANGDDIGVLAASARREFERGLLGFLRGDDNATAVRTMHAAMVRMQMANPARHGRAFFWMSLALLDALKHAALPVDLYCKRLIARINIQARRTLESQDPVADRLLKDVLFALARAQDLSPIASDVRRHYRLEGTVPPDFERVRYGLSDPVMVSQARASVAALKKSWEKVVRGSTREVEVFAEAARGLIAASRSLPYQGMTDLADALAAVPGALGAVAASDEAVSLEVATVILFAEEALDGGLRSDPAYDMRASELGKRLLELISRPGSFSEAAPQWLVDMSRKASERNTLAAFVTELKANLRGCEQMLDSYFRDPAATGQVAGLKPLLDQSIGVLKALNFLEAARACAAIQEDVGTMVDDTHPAADQDRQRIANNLSALGFFVESLLQPAGPGAVYRFDEQVREFRVRSDERRISRAETRAEMPAARGGVDAALEVVGSAESRIGTQRSALTPWLSLLVTAPRAQDVHDNLQSCLMALERDSVLVDDIELKRRSGEALKLLASLIEATRSPGASEAEEHAAVEAAGIDQLIVLLSQLAGVQPPARKDAPVAPTEEEADIVADDDRELLDIFLVEAGEVLAAIQESLQQSRAAPADNRPLTTIRRAFHTLKGSSRMVGLAKFGEAGWAFEQVLNKWLSEEQPGTGRLFELIEAGHGLFSVWLAALHRDPSAVLECASLVAQCAGLRESREPVEKAEPPESPESLESLESPEPLEPVKHSLTGLPAMAEVAADERLVAPVQLAVRELSVEDLEAFVQADDEWVMASEEPADPELDLMLSSTETAAAELEVADTASLRAGFDADAEAEASDEKIPAEKIWIGPRSIDAQLFEIFNAEAVETRARLDAELAGWRERRELSAPESLVRALHSLVGTSRHVGLLQLRALAEPAEQFLLNHAKAARPLPADHFALLYAAIASINSMLVQFSRHIEPQRDAQSERAMMDLAFQWSDPESVVEPLDADRSVRGEALRRKAAQVLGAARQAVEVEHDVYHGLFDEIDPDLGPVFFEETDDLLPQIDKGLHQWRAHPAEEASPDVLMRLLHTIKGSARMAGAMRFGQMIHELETRVEEAIELPEVPETLVDQLVAQYDQAFAAYEELKKPGAQSQPAAAGISTVPPAVARTITPAVARTITPAGMDKGGNAVGAKTRQAAPPLPVHSAGTEVTPAKRVAAAGASAASLSVHAELDAELMAGAAQAAAAAQQVIRVRADVLDRMVSESGEVSVARARLDSEMAVIRQSLGELTENVNRLRAQLREIEIQADNQVQAQIAHAKDARADFDPLEFDRYTRFQELTKMLAESVNDVATVQQNALRSVEAATQDLARQGQVSRSLQQNLMRIRMVQFSTITDRLYRVVRQAAKDADKRVALELKGGNAEIDRSVLERMAAPMEHLLRNAVAHGIEARVDRIEAGKPETGELVVGMRQEGNEVIMSFTDDGAGLDYARIEQRARERGLLPQGRKPTVRELAQLIFAPGFSTALEVTALSGRGIGMDVVRAEVSAMGGRIDIDATPGVGTCFTIHLPVSLAVSQVVLLAVDQAKFAVQAALVEQILQVKPEVLAAAYDSHSIECEGEAVPMYFLGSLLELPQSRPIAQRQSPVVIVRAGSSRIALHVDRVVPNQEVVIKNVGPQLARLTGIAGATILGNGDIVLILNPVQLALASTANQAGEGDTAHFAATDIAATATVMVVDDSVTVRKVTQRLLVREGYTVLLAKDGVDALRQLQDVVPDMMLVDIEMPRMDGFDLTKNVRATERLQHIPIIMITSRTADKHRNHALSLGVDAFLGKPYPEDELLRHVRGFATQRRTERTWQEWLVGTA